MSVLYDIILIGIFLIIVVRGWRQGIVATLMGLLGWIAAAVIIASFGESWSQSIYSGTVEPWAVRTVAAAIPADTISAMNSGADAMQSVQSVLDDLSGLLGGQTIDTASAAAIESALRQDGGSLAQSITQTVLQPLLMSVIRGAVSAVILAACLFVFRFLSRRSARRKKGSGILGKANQLLGGALGIAEGVAVGYLYALLLSILAGVLTVDWLTEQILQNTHLVRLLL